MSIATISERIGSSELASGKVRRAERMSNLHWKLIYLQRQPKWRGRGLVVEKQDQRITVLIPALALETKIRYSESADLNDELRLTVREVDVPDQTAWFRVLSDSANG